MTDATSYAVLARNYDNLLLEAADRGPDALVAFRSKKAWQDPRRLVEEQGEAAIYFRTGEGDIVEFEGRLVEVVTGAEVDARGKQLIEAHALPANKAEAWTDLRTVYLVRGLRSVLATPIETFARPDGSAAAKGMFAYTTVVEREPLPAAARMSEEATEHVEGAVKQVLVNAYERNPKARAACIAAHGTSCVVCGFSFERTYGAIGKGYIHVHHLIPLSQISHEYVVDAVKDLRPVCPNCHAMLHVTKDTLSIAELQERIKLRANERRES